MNVRIPTILAFILLGGIITSTVYVTNNASILFGRSEPNSISPADVTMGSITTSSAVITWKTDQAMAHTLRHTSSSGEQVLYDIRDTDRIAKPYKMHYVEITELSPDTTVSFTILSGNKAIYRGQFKTGPPLSSPQAALPLYGDVPKSITSTSIVIASIGESAPWIVFVPEKKSWAIPLASIRTSDLGSFYCSTNTCENTTPVTLTFITEAESITKTTTLEHTRPYFEELGTESEEVKPVEAVKGITTQVTSTPTISPLTPTPTKKLAPTTTPSATPTQIVKKAEVSLLSPKEGATLAFSKPLIRGEGVPGKTVVITITGEVTQIGKSTVDNDGIWQWTPGYALHSGSHTLSIETTDTNGKKTILTRRFSISKSGERVLSISTPSATLIPSPSIETPTPTVVYETPTPFPTTMPQTGGLLPSIFFVSGGGVLLLLALTLL